MLPRPNVSWKTGCLVTSNQWQDSIQAREWRQPGCPFWNIANLQTIDTQPYKLMLNDINKHRKTKYTNSAHLILFVIYMKIYRLSKRITFSQFGNVAGTLADVIPELECCLVIGWKLPDNLSFQLTLGNHDSNIIIIIIISSSASLRVVCRVHKDLWCCA